MVETANQFTLTLIFMAVLVGLIGGLWYLQRKYPEETLGEIISVVFQRQVWTIQVISILVIVFAEAGMAASFHITGQAESNMIIRFISHALIGITYTAAQLMVAPGIIKMFKSFSEKSYTKAISHVVQVAITFVIALGLPIANLALIANGIGETDKLEILWYWMCSSHEEFSAFLVNAGLPVNYKPFGSVSYVLATSTVLTIIVHPILGISDSIYTVTMGNTRSKKILDNPKDKEKDLSKDDKKNIKNDVKNAQADKEDVLEGKKKVADGFMGNIEFLLNRMGYDKAKNASIWDQQTKKVQTVMDNTTDEAAKGKYAEMVSKFRSRYAEMDKNKSSKQAYHELDMEVFKKFQESPKTGGFGTSLKRPIPPSKN